MASFDWLNAVLLLSLVLGVALAYLLRVATKGKAHFDRVDRQGGSRLLGKSLMEGAYWFFKPLGDGLVFLGVTPNLISWFSLGFGALAGGVLVFGHFGFAAFFATLSAILDALDGYVARATRVSSDAGEVLDATVDRYVEFFFLAGLAIYYREMPVLLGLTLLALMGSFMVSYSTAKAEALQIDPPKSSMRRPERAVYLIVGAVFSPVAIPYFERIRETPVAVGYPMVLAVFLVAILSNLSAVERMRLIALEIRRREAVLAARAAGVESDSPEGATGRIKA